MRQFKIFLLLTLLLVSCQTVTEQALQSTITLTEKSTEAQLQASQTLHVILDANLSSGYAWTIVNSDGFQLTDETIGRRPESQSGGESVQLFTFVGIKAGRHNLVLNYGRPWEKPIKTVSYFVMVLQARTAVFLSQAMEAQPVKPDVPHSPYPAQFDWREFGGVTSVKDQCHCGSCWAFATTAVMESALKISTGLDHDLSEQHLISCNGVNWGCQGGLMAFNYYLNTPDTTGGIGTVSEADFPYQAKNAPCGNEYSRGVRIQDYFSPHTSDVNTIKKAIYEYGPVAVTMCVGRQFRYYTGGNFYYDQWQGCFLPWFGNHGVVLVGWDDADAVWILKNSWGTGWGNGGYMRIGYGTSHVGFFTSCIVYDDGVDLMYSTLWRQNGGYYRLMPVVHGTPLWGKALDWQPVPTDAVPGSGFVFGQSDILVP